MCPAWVRRSLTHFAALLLLWGAGSSRSGMKIIPSSLLTPPTGCFFQPDLICQLCCHQRSPTRPDPGPPCSLTTELSSPAPVFQVRLSTKSGDPFKFSKIHCFVSKWWYATTIFSFQLSEGGHVTHFLSEDLGPIVSSPKCPEGSSQHINPFGFHLQIPSLTASFCRFAFKLITLY